MHCYGFICIFIILMCTIKGFILYILCNQINFHYLCSVKYYCRLRHGKL